MKRCTMFTSVLLLLAVALPALEAGQFRLLGGAGASKMIVISQSLGKPRYILDASTAKITVDGKPAEFKELFSYSIINVKFELKKASKDGINIDGTASEIRILTPEQPKKTIKTQPG
jgi:hypothetical protein